MTARAATPDLATLERSVRRRFRVMETPASVGSRTFSVLHPASAEDLINEADFERDERLPYWAELWPSSRVLGARVLAESGPPGSLLELGCGAGLVSVCAAAAGFGVTVSDYYRDALLFARLNVWRNTRQRASALLLDWRRLRRNVAKFDVVVASDVLYERPYGALVARAIAAALSTSGLALVADPGRVGRDDFAREIRHVGLEIRAHAAVPYVEGQIRQKITIYDIGWR